jgi:hypothetical protein
MTKFIALSLTSIVSFALLAFPQRVETPEEYVQTVEPVQVIEDIEIIPIVPKLTHEQEVWLYALEWCESRGVKTAVNPEDRDGTPSYYSFQFKPATFLNYGIKYGVIAATTSPAELSEMLKSYEAQREIVTHMISDKSVNWHQQFPDCVRKNGLPPR